MLNKDNKAFIKRLFLLAAPIICQEMINTLVNMADTFMITKVGINEVTAVGLANQIFFLFILLCFGIVSGSSIFSGQFYGKGDYSGVHKVMGICFVLTAISAAIFASGAFFIPETLMGFYSSDQEVISLGADYLRIVCFSYFLNAIILTFNSSLRSCSQTKIPMFTSCIALTVNIVLNYIFIFIFGWGVKGAAWATLAARVIEVIAQFCIIYILKLPVATKPKKYFTADRAFMKAFFITTVPVILNEFIWALGTTLYSVAYKYCGTEAQGSVQIAGSIQNIFMVIGMAVGTSSGIMLSNLLGAGEVKKAIKYSRRCLAIAVGLSIIMGLALASASPLIIRAFSISDDIVRKNVHNLLLVIAGCMWIKTFNYTTIVGILRSGGDTTFCLFLDALSVWLVGVPLGFLGAAVFKLDIHFVMLMIYAEEVVKLILSAKRTFSNRWARTLVS